MEANREFGNVGSEAITKSNSSGSKRQRCVGSSSLPAIHSFRMRPRRSQPYCRAFPAAWCLHSNPESFAPDAQVDDAPEARLDRPAALEHGIAKRAGAYGVDELRVAG